MPAVSEKQRRALYAKFGKGWVNEHHFNKVRPPKKKRKKPPRRRR